MKYEITVVILIVVVFIVAVFSFDGKMYSDIEKNGIETQLVSTDHDTKSFFNMMPITNIISDGKGGTTTTTSWVPMYSEIDSLKIKYVFDSKTYNLTTSNFDVRKTNKNRRIKFRNLNDLKEHKDDTYVIVYTK